MYLRILNKDNLIDNTLPIATKYSLNNLTKYNITDGCVYKKNYNETLDNFVARVSNLNEQIKIEPFDEVLINDDNTTLSVFGNNKKYIMLVDNYKETMLSITPKLYDYEINLFSKTKLLEGSICPNLAITPNRVREKLKIWDYVKEYMGLYCPKKREKINNIYRINDVIKTPSDNSLLAKKLNVDCPEVQWNNPTLREVLNDLFMLVDCIPIVNQNNELDFIDLTVTKNDISSYQNINFIEKQQSSEDYVSEIYMNMKNVMQTSLTGIKNSVNTIERFTLNGENYIATEQNFELRTRLPIQQIKHLWMYNLVYILRGGFSTSANYTVFKTDLANLGGYSFIKEKEEYNSLQICYRVNDLPNTIEGKSKTQNCCLYYTRYDNKISGFTTQTKNAPFIVFETGVTNTLYLLKKIAESTINVLGTSYKKQMQWDSNSGNNFLFTFFEVEYETTEDAVFQASKKRENNNRVVVDNQTNSFIDAYAQGNLEYRKANRLGNPILEINQRALKSDINSHLIDIGDYYIENDEKYIIYSVEYATYEDFIEVTALATKDYILKNYYTGINSKIRTWINAKDEALERHDLEKIYCEISTKNSINDFTGRATFDNERLLSALIPYSNVSPIKQAMTRTSYYNETYPDNVNYYSIDSISRVIGNSVVFTIGLKDNYNVSVSPDVDLIFPYETGHTSGHTPFENLGFGNSATLPINAPQLKSTFLDDYGGTPYKNNKYVNEEGNFDRIIFDLRNQSTELTTNDLGLFKTAKITSIDRIDNIYRYTYDWLGEANSDGVDDLYNVFPSQIFFIINGEQLQNTVDMTLTRISNSTYYFDTTRFFPVDLEFTIYPSCYDSARDIIGTSEIKEWFFKAFRKPICSLSEFEPRFLYLSLDKRKDNKEIIKQSIQLEYFADDDNLFITENFVNYLDYIRENITELKLYGSNFYVKDTKTVPSGATLLSTSLISVSNSTVTINSSGYNAYYFVRENSVILGTKNNSFYIRTKRIRSNNVYDTNGIIVEKL